MDDADPLVIGDPGVPGGEDGALLVLPEQSVVQDVPHDAGQERALAFSLVQRG